MTKEKRDFKDSIHGLIIALVCVATLMGGLLLIYCLGASTAEANTPQQKEFDIERVRINFNYDADATRLMTDIAKNIQSIDVEWENGKRLSFRVTTSSGGITIVQE